MFIIINFLNYWEIFVIVVLYLITYNLTLILIFWILFSLKTLSYKTIFFFENLNFNSFNLITLTIVLFSLAGIPPFLGFFLKLILLTFLAYSNFFILFIILFYLLFLALYFYLQNIRFLYNTSLLTLDISFHKIERISTISVFFILLINFFLFSGFFYIDDFFLIIYYFFNF